MTNANWDEIIKDPEYAALSPADRRKVKGAWFRSRVASTPEYKSLPQEGQRALIQKFMIEDNRGEAIVRGREEKAARAQLRNDLARRPNAPRGSKKQLINQRLGIGDLAPVPVITNPFEAAGAEYHRQYMEDTTGGGAIKSGQRALGLPVDEQSPFITEGVLANLAGGLAGIAAQASDPLNVLPGAKGAALVGKEGIKETAKAVGRAALPAARIGAEQGALGTGLIQYGETGEVDLGTLATGAAFGAGLGGVMGAGGAVLAAGANRAKPAPAKPSRIPKVDMRGKPPKVEAIEEAVKPGAVPGAFEIDGKPVHEGQADWLALALKPGEYQFKAADAKGKTNRLDGVEEWDPLAAGRIITHIRDLTDNGVEAVANGHQRTNKAQSLILQGKDVPPARTIQIKESDGWSAVDARNLAARLNVQEGTGTAVDVAKLIRDGGLSDAHMAKMPKQGENARAFLEGQHLAKLGPEAFALVTNDMIVPGNPRKNHELAAEVGRLVSDPAHQVAVLKEMMPDPPGTAREAELFTRQLLADGFTDRGTQQGSLFDLGAYSTANTRGIAKMLKGLEDRIKADKNLSARLLRRQKDIEAIEGNTVNAEASRAIVDDAKRLEFALDRFMDDPEFRGAMKIIQADVEAKRIDGKQAMGLAREELGRRLDAELSRPAPAASVFAPQAADPVPLTPDAAGTAPVDFFANLRSEFEGAPAPAPRPAAEAPAPVDMSFRASTPEDYMSGRPGVYLGFRGAKPGATGSDMMNGTFVAQDRDYAQQFVEWEPGNVMHTVEVRTEKPFVLQQGDNAMRLSEAEHMGQPPAQRTPENIAGLARHYMENGPAFITPQGNQWLRENGFDALISFRDGAADGANSGPVLVSLDPAKVKMAPEAGAAAPIPKPSLGELVTGETGTFDPNALIPGAVRGTPNRNPDDVRASEFFNFRKMDQPADELGELARLVRETVAEQGFDPKARVTQEDIRREAAAIAPELMDDLAPLRDGETLHPAMRQAMRDRVKWIAGEVQKIEEEIGRLLNGGDETARRALEGRAAELRERAKRYLGILIPARSQDGRNLAFHRMMARDSFEPEYWIGQIRRQAGNAPGEAVPHVEDRAHAILNQGRQAEEQMSAVIRELEELGVTDHGISPDAPGLLPEIPMMADGGILSRFWGAIKGVLSQAFPRLVREQDGFFNLDALEQILIRRAQRTGPQPTPRAIPTRHPDPRINALLQAGFNAAADIRQARIQLSQLMATLDHTPHLTVLSALRKAGLLSSLKTLTINAVGGPASIMAEGVAKVPAAGVDTVLSWFNGGRRTILGPRPDIVFEASQRAAAQGAKEAFEVLRYGLTRDQLAKLEIPREINAHLPLLGARGNRIVSGYINFVFRANAAPDRFAKVYAFHASLKEQAKLAARAANTPKPQRRAFEEAFVRRAYGSPDAADMVAVVAQAIHDAELATFTNETVIGQGLAAAGRAMQSSPSLRKYKPVVDASVDMIIPFKQIPTSIAMRVLDFSGIGAVMRGAGAVVTGDVAEAVRRKAAGGELLTAGEQRAIAQVIGRGATGWGLMMFGMFLAQKGQMTGTYDPDMKETNEAAGRTPNSLKVGDRWIPLGQVAPWGNLIALGATLGDWSNDPVKTTVAAFQTVTDMPFLQGVQDLAMAAYRPDKDGAKFVSNTAGSFVPAWINDVALILDPTHADRETSKQFPMSALQGVQKRTPLLRNALPTKHDVLGEPVEAPTGSAAAVWRFHGKTAKEDTNAIVKALVDARVNVEGAPRSMDYHKTKIPLDGELGEAFKAELTKALNEKLAKAIEAPEFAEMDVAERQETLKEILAHARKRARKEFKKVHRDTLDALAGRNMEAAR